MKLIFLVSILLHSANVLGIDIEMPEGYIINPTKKSIENNKWYTVPRCKYWMIQDVKKLGSNLWMEIDGTLQITKDHRNMDGASNFTRGRFTFSSTKQETGMQAILHSATKLHLKSISGQVNIGIYEFERRYSSGECSE